MVNANNPLYFAMKILNKNSTLTNDEKLIKAQSSDFPIVAIGASAGGLEAFELFFKNIPKDNGMAFVVIQHLDPTHVGLLPELLQRITTMTCVEASDGLKIQPNFLYVIPPNKSMSLLNGALHLFEPIESRGFRLPIDIFFRSMADDRQEKSIGIILSGMGSDGSLGLKEIKEKNGIVMVQDPSTAKFDGMPQSAIKTVVADVVAPVEELPSKLISIIEKIGTISSETEIDDFSKTNLDKIIILLREQSGNDFSFYKKNTLMRRIERRKVVHQIDSLQKYVRFCQENPKEVEILFKELLIGVTHFFRDTAVWEMLKEKVLPELLNEFPDGTVLRAWIPGCSTGEEAYSLAITFDEVVKKLNKKRNFKLQIFATDLDPEAIDKARKGFFSLSAVSEVSSERLDEYFTAVGEDYRVNLPIREMIVFAVQNIIKDPPFTKLDIVTCRNLLIYLEPELQQKVLALFSYGLNANGILMLGSAESLNNFKEEFETIEAKLKLYKRTKIPFGLKTLHFPSYFTSTKKESAKDSMIKQKTTENIQTLTDQIILQRFAPASVLVNDSGDIIYITGKTGKYLEPLAGKANWNIHAMAREGIRQELLLAFRKSIKNYTPIVLQNIKVDNNGHSLYVNVNVQRIESPETIKNMILVVFNDVIASNEEYFVDSKTGKHDSNRILKDLELELQRSHEELQSTTEKMITSQEELKSTNEELQSTNEELQSANEELTTSKEEMQSMNEELQTVNAELQRRISDIIQANNDMKNLLNSTGIATLFLDKELNIRRFTDEVAKIFKIRAADIGRPITELVTDLIYPEMDSHAKQVIKNLMTIESIIKTKDGRWFDIRIMPYRTIDDRIDGLVITFFNITVNKNLEIELIEANNTIATKEKTLHESEISNRSFFESAKEGILILDVDTGKIVDVNPYLIRLLGYSKEQFIEKAIWEIGFFKDIIANKDKFLELQQKEFIRYENLPLETAEGKKINVEFISNVFTVNNNKVIQCFIREIND